MPELPEVEIARRLLERWLADRTVVRAEADATRVFRGAEREAFTHLHGRLLSAQRRGKCLLLAFEGNRGLLAHLGMTGKFVRRPASQVEPHSRARFFLDSGDVVHMKDPRLFGRLEPVPADQLMALPTVTALGRDPLVDGLTGSELREALEKSGQDLKVALMDQSRLAGLGNIHAAEALFRARLHPARKPASLTEGEWERLAEGIHAALRYALESEQPEGADEVQYLEEVGSTNTFLIYGRAGEPCQRCGSRVESFTQGGRTTYFCPTCQPLTGGMGRAKAKVKAKKEPVRKALSAVKKAVTKKTQKPKKRRERS